MKTQALDRFLNRAARFAVDLELADVLHTAAKAGRLSSRPETSVLLDLDSEKHPRLAGHKASAHQRQLLFAHLKATLRAAYIKDLYEDFSQYLLELVTAAARKGLEPQRLIGEHRFDVSANDILACSSWDAIISLVAEKLFRRLESEQSTTKLLLALNKKLDLGVDTAIVDSARPFLDLRHLLVHRDGVADAVFCKDYPAFGAKAGTKIRLSHELTSSARTAIFALATHYDQRAIAKKLIAAADFHPKKPA